jgi:hypothetical protein
MVTARRGQLEGGTASGMGGKRLVDILIFTFTNICSEGGEVHAAKKGLPPLCDYCVLMTPGRPSS